LISLGIIYGDIGTSFICNESHTLNTYNADVVLGAFLLFFDPYFTNYHKVRSITLSADNHMKVVFFALYVGKTKIKWLIVLMEVAPYLLTEL
jgi:K+ transporter